MKISEAVGLLELLNQTSIDHHWTEFKHQLCAIQHLIQDASAKVAGVETDIADGISAVEQSVDQFKTVVNYLVLQLKQQIQEQEPHYYRESTRLFEEEMCWETNDYILNRRLTVRQEIDQWLRNRIKIYGDWRLPGMIIRPGLESHIEDMVPLDPLYVLDHNQELIDPAMSKFTEQYQRRLRPYFINDTDADPLHEMPDRQFGFIFAYNFFNYKPLETIERYLNSFYHKLRPGGVALFTFNNCDLANSINAAERYFMCYTPGRRVISAAADLGFELLNNADQPCNWLELKRPGEIVSLRGGQALAKIMRK